MTVDKKKNFIINTLFIAIIVGLVWLAAKYLTAWLLPFVIGLIVALILNRPVTFLSKKTRVPRAVWSLLFVLVTLCALFAIIAGIGSALYGEAENLLLWLKTNENALTDVWNNLAVTFSGFLSNLPESVREALESAPKQIVSAIVSFLSANLSGIAGAVIINVPNILLTFIISVIASFFMTADYPKLSAFFHAQLSEKMLLIVNKSKVLFKENILKMLRGYLLIMSITFVELLIGFSLMRVSYALILALIVAAIDILPVLGTGLVLIPWAAYELLVGEPIMALKVIALYGIMTVIRNIIEPKIIGKQVGLLPIVTLIFMYLGLKLFGVIGMFALPIAVIIIVKLQECGMIHIWKNPPPTDKKE